MGILPGSPGLRRADIKKMGADLIRALVLLTGSVIITYLVPIFHHFVHYGEYTWTHGMIRLYWMMVFERFNKHIKGLCRNRDAPEVHLSNSVRQDVAARYISLVESELYDTSKDPHHQCVLSVPLRNFNLTRKHLGDLRYLGCNVNCLSVELFSVCHVMGIQFRSGEWGKKTRCGSVVTTVSADAQSLYCRVECFVKVTGERSPGYAIVKWFSEPRYPYRIPLVVSVTDDGSVLDDKLGSVIRITDIDPSTSQNLD